MKASFSKRCGCKDPETGKPFDSSCPQLRSRRHGTHGFATRVDTTERRARQLKRYGYATQKAAADDFERVKDLIKLAGDDVTLRRQIGELIFACKRGEPFPDAEEVRRKIGAGVDLSATRDLVRELLEEWYRSKRGRKASTLRGYRQHLDHYLIPLLGDVPKDRLRAARIDGMFDTVEEWNTEIRNAQAEGREPVLPDDLRERHKVVGIATQHRVLATLRNAYNVAVKRRQVEFNPCLGVELPPEERDPARVWSPEQVGQFFEAASEDRLALLYRIVLLRGLRRGEACGLRWADLNLTTGHARIAQTILQLGGEIVVDTPKTKAGHRTVSLDKETVSLLKAHRRQQMKERLAAGESWEEHDLVFPRPNGRPLPPDRVTERFKDIARDAGLPVIKLHEARHTAASLGLEAGLDIKVVSDQLGHSTTRITHDLYQHVRQAVHDDAAEKVVALLPERPKARNGALS